MAGRVLHSATERFHSAMWWVLLVLFAVLVVTEMVFGLADSQFPLYGVLVIVLMTIFRAVVMAIEFYYKNEWGSFCWSIMLIILIGLAALVGRLT